MTATTFTQQAQGSAAIPDTVRFWLRAEGAAALIAGLLVYNALGGNWLLAIPLLLVPDLAAIGPDLDVFPRDHAVGNDEVGIWPERTVGLHREQRHTRPGRCHPRHRAG